MSKVNPRLRQDQYPLAHNENFHLEIPGYMWHRDRRDWYRNLTRQRGVLILRPIIISHLELMRLELSRTCQTK